MSVLDAFSLSGKVSVVTGANRGIGRALATALAEAGSDVVLLVRDTGGAAEVIAELDALGVTAIAVMADVTEAAQVRRAVGEIMDRFGARRCACDMRGSSSGDAKMEDANPSALIHVTPQAASSR